VSYFSAKGAGPFILSGKIGHKATECYSRKNKEQAQEDKKNNNKQKYAWKGEWSKEKV